MTSRLRASTTGLCTFTIAAIAGLLGAACTIDVNKAPPPRAAVARPGTPAPAPAPGHFNPPAPAPNLRAAHTVAPQLNLVHAAPIGALDKVNVQAIAALKARSGRACGAHQVAPNQWVHIDCAQYRPVKTAVAHMSALKLQAMQAKSSTFRARNPSLANTKLMQSTTAGDTFPQTVDHRTDGGEGPVKDQGEVGDCTAFSLSTVMDNQLRRANQTQTISPTHLWSHYGQPDMQMAGDSNLNKGITTFDVWPYSGKEACEFETDGDPDSAQECQQAYGATMGAWQSDSSAKTHQSTGDKNGQVKISEIDALSSPPNIEEIQSVLSSGSDVWIGMSISSDAWQNSAMKAFVIPDWSQTDGGHAVTLSGYRHAANGSRQFLVHNNWASSWGDGGYAWISEAMITQHLQFAYKIKLAGATPAAPPVQPVILTDDDCPGTQLIDMLTGQCANICPDGTRPANGQCPF